MYFAQRKGSDLWILNTVATWENQPPITVNLLSARPGELDPCWAPGPWPGAGLACGPLCSFSPQWHQVCSLSGGVGWAQQADLQPWLLPGAFFMPVDRKENQKGCRGVKDTRVRVSLLTLQSHGSLREHLLSSADPRANPGLLGELERHWGCGVLDADRAGHRSGHWYSGQGPRSLKPRLPGTGQSRAASRLNFKLFYKCSLISSYLKWAQFPILFWNSVSLVFFYSL